MATRSKSRGKFPTNGEDAPSTNVKIKDGSDLSTMFFEWEGDKHKWTSYSAEHNTAIREACSNGEASVDITAGGAKLEIKLDYMVQKNKASGWERCIRCLLQDEEEYFVWQWQDDRKKWYSYLPAACQMLEEAHKSNSGGVDMKIAGRDYTVDMKQMQQCNKETDAIRSIQRLQTDFTPPKEEPKPTAGGDTKSKAKASKSSSAANKSGRKRAKEEPDESEEGTSAKIPKQDIKTVRLTGKNAPVDIECVQMINKAHVFMEGNNIYDAMLNQTNLKNNNNKYYIIQLLKENTKNIYYIWFRWGRVGMKGQNNLIDCGSDLEKAKELFVNKFWDKTRNEWSQRNKFSKVPGKYDQLKMDYSTEDMTEDDKDGKKENKPKLKSKLDQRLQDLITLICNIQAMEDMVVEMKYDAQKAPLGKLTIQQIKAGYAALKKIEKCVQSGSSGPALVQACDEFYTRVPHNFGMQRPPIIRTRDELKAKLTLLEALGDIQFAMTVLKQVGKVDEHPVDRQYHALKCELVPLEKTHPDFKIIQSYLKNTHAKTHNHYKMEVVDIFKVAKEGESARYNDVGNRKLLWHGSRLTNWAGILGHGLRIAPPEAPVTGYMFGKGLYFADMSSKSCNYCFATQARNIGVVLLSEVALGNSNDLLAADYTADKIPTGKDSVKGLGKVAPDPSGDIAMSDGTVVPAGKGIKTGVANPNGYTLNYNEFVVYNTNQVKMRYLIKVKFLFN